MERIADAKEIISAVLTKRFDSGPQGCCYSRESLASAHPCNPRFDSTANAFALRYSKEGVRRGERPAKISYPVFATVSGFRVFKKAGGLYLTALTLLAISPSVLICFLVPSGEAQ